MVWKFEENGNVKLENDTGVECRRRNRKSTKHWMDSVGRNIINKDLREEDA